MIKAALNKLPFIPALMVIWCTGLIRLHSEVHHRPRGSQSLRFHTQLPRTPDLKPPPWHVVSHSKEKGWSPAWVQREGTPHELAGKQSRLQFIDQSFGNVTAADYTQNPELLPMLAFIRIPKTASTSILSWIASNHQIPHRHCILGPLGSRPKLPEDFETDHLSCSHYQYETTVLKWAKEMTPQIRSVQPANTTYTTSLDIFTMVRDPFDRLVSLFHYVQRIYPNWSQISTPEQNATILANNMSGWMELLHMQGTKCFFVPYQKGAIFESDFATATRLIQGQIPRVFTVVQECFEASLWLLTDRFPAFFERNMTEAFLNNSNNIRRNTKSRFQQRSSDEMAILRSKAKVWFADDFTFYEAAMMEFRKHLAASRVAKHVQDECFQVLDSRSAH